MNHPHRYRIAVWTVACVVLLSGTIAIFAGLSPAIVQAQAVTTARITPILECVVKNSNRTYTARFGYDSQNSAPITIPIGGQNKTTPGPQDRGQTTVFQPGRVVNAFAVTWNGDAIEWTVKGPDGNRRSVTASSRSNVCAPPTATPTNTPTNTPVPPTATPTNTPTNTPVVPTATATDTPTNTPVPPTATATDTPTNTPVVPTATATDTPTNTPVVPTATATDTPTNTPVPQTATPTNTPTDTPTPTNTPT